MAKGILRGAKKKKKKRSGYYDYHLLAVVIILICFGLVMLYSASAYDAATTSWIQDDMYYFRRQAIFSALSVFLALGVSRIDYHFSIRMAPLIYLIAIVLMAMVKFTPFGVEAGGAKRWLNIAGITFQPAEIAKIAIILIMPSLILRMGRKIMTARAVIVLFLVTAVQAFAAYYLTDNLSTALIILGIGVFVIFLSHPKTLPFILAFGLVTGITTAAIVWLNNRISSSSSFRIRRVLAWLHPEENLQAGGYQVMQALYAIGSGGFFGRGLGNSTQKLSAIPEAQNDMIFSIICEELGLFGAIIVLVLFGYLLYRLFVIAQNAKDLYGTLVVSGVFVHIALQVILNISVALNVIPTTGVTLPFVSYGGTSVIFLMIEIGLALSVARGIDLSEESEERGTAPELSGN